MFAIFVALLLFQGDPDAEFEALLKLSNDDGYIATCKALAGTKRKEFTDKIFEWTAKLERAKKGKVMVSRKSHNMCVKVHG